jgi:hypothetical protein
MSIRYQSPLTDWIDADDDEGDGFRLEQKDEGRNDAEPSSGVELEEYWAQDKAHSARSDSL